MENIIIIYLVKVIIFAVTICLVIAMLQSKHNFKCKNCGKEFHPKWTQMTFEVHSMKEHKIKCPCCGVKDYCTDEGKSKR